MKIIDNLRKVFLRFVFAGNIAEMNAFGAWNVDFRLVARTAEHHRVAADTVKELPAKILPDSKEDENRENPREKEGQKRRCLFLDILCKGSARLIKALGERRVIHESRLIFLSIFFFREYDLI